MLKKPSTVFSTLQKRILQGCAVMMMIGGVILAIDKFVVRKDEPSTQEQLSTLEEELGLAQRNDDASKSALRNALAAFEPLTGPIGKLGPILNRDEDGARLWLFEYTVRELALYHPGKTHLNIAARHFGILIAFETAPGWPTWMGDSVPPRPPFTALLVARLAAMDDYRMGLAGQYAFFTSGLETGVLAQAMNRSISAEFHPGLFNSAMRLDVQRALDIVNGLEGEQPRLTRFYQIDVPKLDIELPSTEGITRGMEEARTTLQKELDALRAERQKQSARLREESAARRAEVREGMRESLATSREEARQRLEAITEKANQRREESAARRAEAREVMQEHLAASREKARQHLEAVTEKANQPRQEAALSVESATD
ncbi:MAG: apolipoprotein A1/A4/E family protein [Gammaproteobacteria bacterium]|nr:apolipoprotein A1/A4/E family protein [Gammaproteobacteria bacterium]